MLKFIGQHYLFMVNSATQAVTLTFSGLPDAPRTDLFHDSELPASGGSFSITLDPYEVAGFRFDGYDAWRALHFRSVVPMAKWTIPMPTAAPTARSLLLAPIQTLERTFFKPT